jgi:hypothetical protein
MLMGALAGDIDYQRKLSQDFRKRRLHASTEIRIWEYTIGRPKDEIALSANVTMNERLAAERDMLNQLDLKQLEALALESQRMMDRAFAGARAKVGIPDGTDVPSLLTMSRRETASTKNDDRVSDDAGSTPPNLRVDAEPEGKEDQ